MPKKNGMLNNDDNKLGKDRCPAATTLPGQKDVDEDACCEICVIGPPMEQIMDMIGRPSQK